MAVKSEKKKGSKKQNQSQRDKIREKNRKKENKKRNKQIKEKYLSMVKRREFQIWAVTLILCFFGAIMIYSASSTTCANSEKYNYDSFYYFKRQMVFILLGLVCMVILPKLNYTGFWHFTTVGYLVGIGLILWVFAKGEDINGAKRWFQLGPISFQVAEPVKVFVILALACLIQRRYVYMKPRHKIFEKRSAKVIQAADWIRPIIIKNNSYFVVLLWGVGAVPAVMLWQLSRDLSSAIVVLGITYLITVVCIKSPKLKIVALVCVIAVSLAMVLSIYFNLPSETLINADTYSFRKARIAAWLAPQKYASTKSYQTLQSLYAIGSGGIFGKGFGNSVQKKPGFIPEAHTDMIFSIICEELGLVGALVIIGLLIYLLYLIYQVAKNSENVYGSVLAMGVFFHIGVQSIINIAVNINLFPNTGIPLPFFSYGGTSIVIIMAEMGLVISIDRYHCLKRAKRLYGEEKEAEK